MLDAPNAAWWRRPRLETISQRHPIALFTVRRVAGGLLTLFIVSVLVFVATDVLPGDAASSILGRTATPEQLSQLRDQIGAGEALPERYLDWVRGLFSGDLGNTSAGYAAGGEITVWSQIRERLANSLVLGGITFILVVPISLILGVVSALRAGRLSDNLISVLTLTLVSQPEFVVGALFLAVFFGWLDLLPPVSLIPPGSSALEYPLELILPVLTLLAVLAGIGIRFVRAGVIETLATDYVLMARAHALPPRVVLWRYALRNALPQTIQVFALILQYLVGGLIIIEVLFAFPGIGNALVTAILTNDLRLVQSIAVILATIYIAINVIADLLVVMLVPRLRTERT